MKLASLSIGESEDVLQLPLKPSSFNSDLLASSSLLRRSSCVKRRFNRGPEPAQGQHPQDPGIRQGQAVLFRLELQSLMFQRLQVQHVINFTEGPSRDDVDKHWKDRRVLRVRRRSKYGFDTNCHCSEDQIPLFVERVAPQPGKAPTYSAPL